MSERKLFTSESVSEGHPDKIADQISDAILDAILEQDPEAHVAAETAVYTGSVHVFGEISNHGIGSSLGTSYFCLGELSHEFEDEIENGLVVAFRAVVQLVGNPGEEGPQAGKEGVGITFS